MIDSLLALLDRWRQARHDRLVAEKLIETTRCASDWYVATEWSYWHVEPRTAYRAPRRPAHLGGDA